MTRAVVQYPSAAGHKIVAAGYASTPQTSSEIHFALARYSANGIPDPSFGNNGKVLTKLGYSSSIWDLVVQDQKLIAVGWSRPIVNRKVLPHTMTIARYTEAGTLDPTFGSGGVVRVDPAVWGGTFGEGRAATLQGARKDIVIVGYSGGVEIILGGLNGINGSLDTSFGGDGVVTHRYGDLNDGNAIATDGNGDIYVAGGAFFNSQGVTQSAVFKFNADGQPDSGFGETGVVLPQQANPLASGSEANALAFQTDGTFLVGGQASLAGGENTFFVTRYLAKGILDTTFGAASDYPGVVTTDITTSDDGVKALAVESDGIVAAGFARGTDSFESAAVVKYGLNGESAAPLPTLSIGDVTQEEGNGGTANPTKFTFTLTLSADATGDVTVNYAARDSAARYGVDYYLDARMGSVTIPNRTGARRSRSMLSAMPSKRRTRCSLWISRWPRQMHSSGTVTPSALSLTTTARPVPRVSPPPDRRWKPISLLNPNRRLFFWNHSRRQPPTQP